MRGRRIKANDLAIDGRLRCTQIDDGKVWINLTPVKIDHKDAMSDSYIVFSNLLGDCYFVAKLRWRRPD